MTYGLGVMLKNIYRGVWQSVAPRASGVRGVRLRGARSRVEIMNIISQSERRKMRMRSVYCDLRFFVSFSTRGRVKVRTTFKVVPSGMRQRAIRPAPGRGVKLDLSHTIYCGRPFSYATGAPCTSQEPGGNGTTAGVK